MTRRGLKNFDCSGVETDRIKFRKGSSRVVRFLEESDEIRLFKKHFIRKGYIRLAINCLNDEGSAACPLCKVAVKKWMFPVSEPVETLMTLAIDRTDGKAKYFEGNVHIKNALMDYLESHDRITSVDFEIKRSLNGRKWEITPLEETYRPLNESEKALGSKLDVPKMIKSTEKSVPDIEHAITDAIGYQKKKEENDEKIDAD